MLKALIVDDDKASNRAISLLLSSEGWSTESAYSFADGVKSLKEDINYAILDIMLPDGNGLDILKIIKQDYPHIKTILVTGTYISNPKDFFKTHLPDFFFQKPIDYNSLIREMKGN